MTWDQLVPQLHQLKLNWPDPDLLLIHLGDNDINQSTTEELLSSIKKDLTSIRNIFPQCLIVWSDILPIHFRKHGSEGLPAVDRIHDVINHRVHAMVAELGGTAVTHENIEPELHHLGGIHLSNFIIERFYLNIQHFVDQWEKEVNRAFLSTSPDVLLSLSPTDSSSSYSGTLKRAERGGIFKNPAVDDSENTSVSLHRRAKRGGLPKNPARDDSGNTSVSLHRRTKRGGLPKNPAGDDWGNTSVSLQQSQKVIQVPDLFTIAEIIFETLLHISMDVADCIILCCSVLHIVQLLYCYSTVS